MKRTTLFLFLLTATALYALPGIHDPLPQASGEYVYYRDYTFVSETYVGFLQYDDGACALRYIAREPQSGSSEVVTLLSLDPEKDFIEITGEKILAGTESDDVGVINYLHDLLYEFAGRRKKINDRDFSKPFIVEEDFYQFGGQASITYAFYIPLFNVKSVSGKDGKILFEAVTFGQMADTNDESFFNYVPDKSALQTLIDENVTNAPILQKKEAQIIQTGGATVTLDGNWTQVMDNMWMFGDYAFFMMDTSEFEESAFSGGKFTVADYFTRSFLCGSQGNYPQLERSSIKLTADSLTIDTVIFAQQEEILSHDIKMMIKTGESTYVMAFLSVYEGVYQANKAYFDAIASSVSAGS